MFLKVVRVSQTPRIYAAEWRGREQKESFSQSEQRGTVRIENEPGFQGPKGHTHRDSDRLFFPNYPEPMCTGQTPGEGTLIGWAQAQKGRPRVSISKIPLIIIYRKSI